MKLNQLFLTAELRDKTRTLAIVLNQTPAAAHESQRDSGSKPKVARHELPWVNVIQNFFYPNGVAAGLTTKTTQPRWGNGA